MEEHQMTNKPLLSAFDALSLISTRFPAEWAKTSVHDVQVTRITGRLINTLHLVRRQNTASLEPTVVLVRHFGFAEDASDLVEPEEPPEDNITLSAADQVNVFEILSRRGWGPKVYGVFEGGRLKEYIDAHTIIPAECTHPGVGRDVARSYTRLHSLRLPFDQDSFTIVSHEFIEAVRAKREEVMQAISAVDDERAREYANIFDETDWIHELEWVAELFEKHNCRITVNHGDSNHLNILIKDYESECRAMLIDYETVSYSSRGIDIGGHFNERMYCYNQPDTQLTGYPAPNLKEQRFWCEAYLQEMRDLGQEITQYDTVDHLLLEASIGRLYHLLFTNMICTVYDEVEVDPLFLSGLTHMVQTYRHLKAEFVRQSRK